MSYLQTDLQRGNGYYPKDGRKRFWLIPPEIYDPLNSEFHFDFDPCPYPFDGADAVKVPWGESNWVNPPFTRKDAINRHGATAIARRAVEEQSKGNTSVFIMPVPKSIYVLLQAKPEIRFVGQVAWMEVETKERSVASSANVLFILRGMK